MFTRVSLENGLLRMTLMGVSGDGTVARARWREAMAPAIAFLRSWGGGALVIPHRPHDLLP